MIKISKKEQRRGLIFGNECAIYPSITQSMTYTYKITEDWLKQERTRFNQIEYNYDQIGLEYGDIEFVKTGIVKVDPYIQQYIDEKRVDIALAVKMISLSVKKNAKR